MAVFAFYVGVFFIGFSIMAAIAELIELFFWRWL